MKIYFREDKRLFPRLHSLRGDRHTHVAMLSVNLTLIFSITTPHFHFTFVDIVSIKMLSKIV